MEIAKFPIYQLENSSGVEIDDEEDGRFYKYWTNQTNLGRCLFKAAFPYGANPKQHRMDWREKVAGELGQLLGLPMARTELASICVANSDTWLPGSISVDYTPNNCKVISIRDFLSQADPNYDSAYSESFEDGYNVSNVIFYLHQNSVGLPLGWNGIEGIADGADLLVGYLLLDAWLGATDRHDENLEIAISESGYSLCPTFDHGDCLGSKLAQEEQQSGNFADPRLMESCWLERLREINLTQVVDIFSRIHDELIFFNETRFSMELLESNRQNIFNLKLRSSDLANDN